MTIDRVLAVKPRVAAMAAALGIALALTVSAAQAQQRPNFVFIALDDLAPLSVQHLNDPSSLLAVAVPNRAARYALSARITPNLNRLASRGVTFSQTWTSYPLCNASRAALLTGIAAARSNYTVQNAYTLRDPRSELRDAVTLPQRLQKAGYTTLGIGKIFHFAEVKVTNHGIADWPDIARSWTGYIQELTGTLGNVVAAPGAGLGRLKFGVELDPTFAQPDWINAGLAATLLRTGSVQTVDRFGFPAAMAIDPVRPFFLGVGIQRPHSPWAVPREWLDLVPSADLQRARINLNKELDDLDDTYRASKGGRGKFRGVFGFDGTPRTARKARLHLIEAMRHYFAAVAFADACVGRVLDALDASPYAQNTVVVLWSDHGYSWGQKLHLGKSSLWEPSLRSEFIAADLRYPATGSNETRPVSLQDIYPTICDLAGLGSSEPPLGDGQSLVGALHGGRAPTRAILASYGKRQRAIRLGEWKYITYGTARNNDELYNLDRDPLERSNLIHKAPAAILSRLKSELHRITSRYDTTPDPTPSRPPSIPVGQPAK